MKQTDRVIGMFLLFVQHLVPFGEFCFFVFFTPFFFTVFDVGKMEVHVTKYEQLIRRLHYEIPLTYYEMQGVIWWSRVFVTSHFFHFWPLTFGIVWRKCGVMSPNLAPKYIILIFQREDKLLLNMERKQTTYCKLFHPVITQQWCGIGLIFA